jgi:hypothetical protein
VKTGTTLLTDGHRSYPGLTDYRHDPRTVGVIVANFDLERRIMLAESGGLCHGNAAYTHANVTEKGEFREVCARLGLVLVAPDTSPRAGYDLVVTRRLDESRAARYGRPSCR